MVEVILGPIGSAGAHEFLLTAQAVLRVMQREAPEGFDVPPETVESMDRYVAEWLLAAETSKTFEWRAEIDPLLLRRLVACWFALAAVISGRSEELGLPLASPAAEPFYHHLIVAVTEALQRSDDPEHLGERAREAWPGIADDDRPPVPPSPAPLRLVIVDDTEDIRLLMRYALGRDPRFEIVGEAEDGAAAVDLCAGLQPDVVLLDLSMPVMDGFEALPLIMQISPSTRVVVHSAADRAGNEPRCRALGAVAYIEKTSSIGAVAAALAATR